MKILIQGMRRNGTTVLFDLFREDGRFRCFYEPLAAAINPCYGGGSGINESVDYFENIRQFRARTLECGVFGNDPQIFNYGAPRNPRLEFVPDCPDAVAAYLTSMLESGPHVAIKFTRAAYKMAYLHQLAPDAHLLHIIRDPRRVVASHLFGKDQKYRSRYEGNGEFFTRVSSRIGWSASAFSDILLQQPEYAHLRGLPDYQRLLLLWKDGFEKTWEAGRKYFGDRYRLVRHEDLSSDPRAVLEGIYAALGMDMPPAVLAWAALHLRAHSPVFDASNPHWRAGYERVGLNLVLEMAGYPMP